MSDETTHKLIRLPAVISATGLSKSTLYNYVARGKFPKPVRIGDRAVAWKDGEVRNWISGRVEASRGVA